MSDDQAAERRETNAISEIERAYGDLVALLRRGRDLGPHRRGSTSSLIAGLPICLHSSLRFPSAKLPAALRPWSMRWSSRAARSLSPRSRGGSRCYRPRGSDPREMRGTMSILPPSKLRPPIQRPGLFPLNLDYSDQAVPRMVPTRPVDPLGALFRSSCNRDKALLDVLGVRQAKVLLLLPGVGVGIAGARWCSPTAQAPKRPAAARRSISAARPGSRPRRTVTPTPGCASSAVAHRRSVSRRSRQG
jgi:hypothetical protein